MYISCEFRHNFLKHLDTKGFIIRPVSIIMFFVFKTFYEKCYVFILGKENSLDAHENLPYISSYRPNPSFLNYRAEKEM